MPAKVRRWMIIMVVLGCVVPSGLVSNQFAAAQSSSVVQHDFEDGTTQGWISRGGGVALASVTEAAYQGARSLKTTGRTANWNGPSLNVLGLLQKGVTYEITGYVRLVSGQPASTLKFTVERV